MSLKDVVQRRASNQAQIKNPPKTEPAEPEKEPGENTNDDVQTIPEFNEIVYGANFVFKYDYLRKRRKEKRYVRFNGFERLNSEDSAENSKRYRFRKSTAPPLQIEYKKNASAYNVDDVKSFTPKQHVWNANTVTNEDLRTKTNDVVSSNNRLKMRRYIFVGDFLANLNGMIYYSLPLLANIVWLLFSIFDNNFFGNLIIATLILIDLLVLVGALKEPGNIFTKIIGAVILLALPVVGLILLNKYWIGFYNLLDGWYIAKLVLIYFCVWHFLKFYVVFGMGYAQDVQADFGNVVKCKSGKPRVGKTSQGVHEATVLALIKWNQLQFDFWDWHSREAEILARNNLDELLEYHAIKESYSFYIIRTCIPCLWSNIGIEYGGRMSHKVTLDHIRGAERLPLYSVVFFDEIGAVLKAEMGKKGGEERMYDVSDMFRLGGHFLKWAVICCEQDFNNFYIDCRRVVGVNELIESQTWVCKPWLASGILNFFKFCVGDSLDKNVKRKPKLAKFISTLDKFVKSIGFRRQVYRNIGNTQTGAEATFKDADGKTYDLGNRRVRYIPSSLIANYDDRAYKQDYFSYFDKKITGEIHTSLHIRASDVKYARQYVSETPFIAQKRKAQQNNIEKIA